MRTLVQRIRGAMGIGLTWGAAWSFVGMMPRLVFGINADAPFPIIFGVLGFAAGITFSALLMMVGGRRSFDQMSLPRFGAWGAVGGFLLSAVFARAASLGLSDVIVILPTFALASAVCASGSLALARRAEYRALSNGRREIRAGGSDEG